MKKISDFSFIESFGGFSRGFLWGSPLKQGPLTAVPTYFDKLKSTASPCFFVCIMSWGCPPQTRTQETFQRKVSWNFKSFAKINWCIRWEILLLTFLIRKVREGGLERSSNYWRKKKKRGFLRVFFVCVKCWGYPPQTRTQRTFREKSFGISKALLRIKWCIRCKVLLLTFLRKKSRSDYVVVPFIGDIAVSSCLFFENVSYFEHMILCVCFEYENELGKI